MNCIYDTQRNRLPNHFNQIENVLTENKILFHRKFDHFYIKNSSVDKIVELIRSFNYCPLVSNNPIDNTISLTCAPCKLPPFFHSGQEELKLTHFTFHEISLLLEQEKFMSENEEELEDPWNAVNEDRQVVSCAVDAGVSMLVSRYLKKDSFAVEIGSGKGYNFPKNLSEKIVRTQIAEEECQLLNTSILEPVYQLNVEELYKQLKSENKKIPLFFALDVFDAVKSKTRKESFEQLSKLQDSGDQMLILLDTNPCLDCIFEELQSEYPNCSIHPFIPEGNAFQRQSAILIPTKSESDRTTLEQYYNIAYKHASFLVKKGDLCEAQKKLNKLHKSGLEVIIIEEFFAEQCKKELKELGYDVRIFYDATFKTNKISKKEIHLPEIIYKSVTDHINMIKFWPENDPKIKTQLLKKSLFFPTFFNAKNFQKLRTQNKRVFGAEFLVIEATKTSK